jgi:ubiquinone/menaquinone biosynthesis C-methylase UbiE
MHSLVQQESSGVVPIVGPGALPSFSDAHNVLTWSHERQLLRRHGLEPGMSILSLGCGSGSFEQYLAAELRPMHLAARDSDPWAIAEARSRNLPRPIELSSGSYQSLPWPDSSFDAGLCRHALWSHSPEEQSRIFAELLRVVRPGGVLYFLDQVSTPGDGQPEAETIERAFRQLLRLRRQNGWGIEQAPTQVGVLRKNGLAEVRIDLMLVGSADQESVFADMVTCWRMESVELALAAGWSPEEIRRLDRGLRAFRQAAAAGQATLPVWVLSGRKEGGLLSG